MEKIFLSQFALQFAEASLTSLVESFNVQVGNRGFNSARAAHDHASSMSLYVVALMCQPFLTETQYLLLII